MHIVIDARIRPASTGKPIDRLLEYLQVIDDTKNTYTVLLKPGDEWKPKNQRFSIKTCPYKMFSFNPWQQISFSWFLYRLRPDLVHFTLTGQQPIFYFGRQITLTHDLTMLSYVRAGRLPKWAHAIRMLGYRFLLWQSHRKARTIIVPTEYVRDALYKHHLFVRRKIIVTLEASEPPITDPAQQPDNIKIPFILHVGSPFPHKNIERLVEAFGLITEKEPNLTLVLAGKREYYFKLLEKNVRKLPYADKITFTGFVSDGELKWLYQNAAAYVLPSLSEGFGLPGLEAMVHNCPLVSSGATCLPEVYEDAALYFDPENIEDMQEAILKVVRGPKLREKLIHNGQRQVKKFSWKRMTEQNLAIYKSTLGK